MRAVWWALRRLAERGLARKVARGLYELLEDPARLASLPVRPANESQGTRVPSPSPSSLPSPSPPPEGPRFDNVRGLTPSGYVRGDRGRALSQADLARFERVSYAEVQYVVRGLGEVPGVLVIYTNLAQDGPNSIRIEWRPPRGYVKVNGLASAVRMFWAAVALAQAALLELSLRAGPPDHLRLVLRRLARRVLPMLRPLARLAPGPPA